MPWFDPILTPTSKGRRQSGLAVQRVNAIKECENGVSRA
jgi:hypothetical protein